MKYLDSFEFASVVQEYDFLMSQKRTCYDTHYPFQIFPAKEFRRIDFEDITLLYGSNGSGKSTALNVIANRIDASRDTVYNRSNFFEDYLQYCQVNWEDESYKDKIILTSDGVFDCMLDIRHLNQGIDRDRERAFDDYIHWKMLAENPDSTALGFTSEEKEEFEEIRRHPLAHLHQFKQIRTATRKTVSQSKYVRKYVADNVREKSNGESAFDYFVNRIDRDSIYILDEPENSLSPQLQLELVKYIENSARFFNCQFVIATHSPFVLSIKDAKIYDLDECPVSIRKWTDLPNVRTYFDFFREHENKFE